MDPCDQKHVDLAERTRGGRGASSSEAREPAPAPVARPSLFRPQAVAAQRRGSAIGEPLRISPPWATWIVALGALLVIGAIALASLSSVEVTSLGRGIMQANGPPQILATQVGGTVTKVLVRPGEPVVSGQEIAHLESTTTAASLLEASRKLELAQRSLDNFRQRRKPLYAARMAQQRAQMGLLERRAESSSSSIDRMIAKAKSVETLKGEGLASTFDSVEAAENVAITERDAFRVQEEDARIREQIAALDADVSGEEWKLTSELEAARAQRDSLQFALDAAVVRAPIDGVVGSISARPGDPVVAGAPLGRVVAAAAPRTVVVYIPERDRAFVEKNAAVRVEVDQLPVWEFGALHGRVTRVASEIASERDLHDTLGDQVKIQEPMYRVEVALDEDAAYVKLKDRLRPESLTHVRFTLRHRRVITVLFEPLQRWLR
ncbi:MAG TPA: HlyD family efflux transporter periplasmic adaptor subunit [Labilithrix sp.]|nr:HlyD family efflux transporter periplasmic adaptor subunit [Labilithrix sp.]